MLVYTKLQEMVRRLAELPDNGDPLISSYINLKKGQSWQKILSRRMKELQPSYDKETWQLIAQAFQNIWDHIEQNIEEDKSSIAVFARAGKEPYLSLMHFDADLPVWISVDTVPNIYHLVELKDTYHRYVVLISTKEYAKIYEINLGEVTYETWLNKPQLRQRVGREWTRQHFRARADEHHRRFVRKQIEIVDGLMSTEGYTHLILAGDERLTAETREELPKNLESKLIQRLSISPHDFYDAIVSETLETFIKHEQQESKSTVEDLLDAFHKHELAVIGVEDSIHALERGQADTLVISSDFEFPSLWVCTDCGTAHLWGQVSGDCFNCGSSSFVKRSTRDELTRLAVLFGTKVETVKSSQQLEEIGGVGCLLRYGPVVNVERKNSFRADADSLAQNKQRPATKHLDAKLLDCWENEGGALAS